MGDKSAIEWTEATWNPVTGCSKCSPGCANCYAERISRRMGWTSKPWNNQNAPENIQLHPDRLGLPYKWSRPRRIFVNSMSDLFHELVPDQFIAQIWGVMAANPKHIFQVLTKRAKRMADLLTAYPPLHNVWVGVSVEDQERAEERLPHLARIHGFTRWVSCEPLLDSLHLNYWLRTRVLDWVVVGGESGPAARPMKPEWARRIRDDCQAHRVPFFFKQWGGLTPKSGGRELDGSTWGEYPQGGGDNGHHP